MEPRNKSAHLWMRMSAAMSPLKVLLAHDTDKPVEEVCSFMNAITRAFQGGTSRSSDGTEEYYASGEELGVDVLRLIGKHFWTNRSSIAELETFSQTCGHVLVIVFLEGEPSPEFANWLRDLGSFALAPENEGRVGVLPITLDSMSERASVEFFDEFQRLPIADLGETALRSGYLGLTTLQNAWSLLGENAEEQLRLFISHAKRDGAPVALALKAQIESLKFLNRFYDAQDILAGTRWRRALENGVKKSVMVVLRTDIYEQRPWCIQELEWAEEYCCPIVIVDARNSLLMPRESLIVAGVPSVRIPDGNLVRILNAALREAVRVRLLRRSVQILQEVGMLTLDRAVVLSRASLASLGVVCETRHRSKKKTEFVVLPEPFRESLRPVAEQMLYSYFPEARMGTIRDFVVNPKTRKRGPS